MSQEFKSKRIRSFARNRSRKLRPARQSLVDTLLPQLEINAAWLEGVGRGAAAQSQLPDPMWLEIGFGQGEHLAMQARLHRDVMMIGCEPYIQGLGKLLQEVVTHDLRNLRIYQGDAREVMEKLPDASVSRVFILFPDPWPKTRHHKRRLVNHELFALLARIMKSGGELLIATDHEDYLTWILEHIQTQPYFEWTARCKADWANPPEDWVTTKYQAKAIREGRVPHWLRLCRNHTDSLALSAAPSVPSSR